MKSNRSAIAKDILTKSGAIRTASLVELWTRWSRYVGADCPKPPFKELYQSNLQVVDARLKDRKNFCNLLGKWSFDFKPTGLSDADILDNQLDEKRVKTIPPLTKIILGHSYSISAALNWSSLAACWGDCWSAGYSLHINKLLDWFLFWERQSYRDLPPQTLPVLIRLRKRLASNLKNWDAGDLQDLGELIAPSPGRRGNEQSIQGAATPQKDCAESRESKNAAAPRRTTASIRS